MEERTKLLELLIKLESPIKQTIKKLDKHDWRDVDGKALVTLTREQTIATLKRFVDGEISAEDLYLWADALELREDIDFGQEDDEGAVFDIIANITTTYVARSPLTEDEVREYIQALSGQSS